jgi:hypothetical protein
LGIGDWGLGIGAWGVGPNPKPQNPNPKPQNPNPQSPFKIFNKIKYIFIFLIYKYIFNI